MINERNIEFILHNRNYIYWEIPEELKSPKSVSTESCSTYQPALARRSCNPLLIMLALRPYASAKGRAELPKIFQALVRNL